MYTKYNEINTKKLNTEILKAFNGTKTKDLFIGENNEKFYICVAGATVFQVEKYYFPFDLGRIGEYTESERIRIKDFSNILADAQKMLDRGDFAPAELEKMTLIDMGKNKTVLIYKDSRGIRHGIDKDLADFLHLENCKVYGNKQNEPLYFTDSHYNIIACILPIKPKTDNWEL